MRGNRLIRRVPERVSDHDIREVAIDQDAVAIVALSASRRRRALARSVIMHHADLPPPSRYVAPIERREVFEWWEFESEVKRKLTLEVKMRALFFLRD